MAHIIKAGAWIEKRKPLKGELDLDYLITSLAPPSTVYTASNGITKTLNNFTLGGTLTDNVLIDGLFDVSFGDSSSNKINTFNIYSNNSVNIREYSGNGIYINNSFSGIPNYATIELGSRRHVQAFASTTNGLTSFFKVNGDSSLYRGVASYAGYRNSVQNSIYDVFVAKRELTGVLTGQAGIGARIGFLIQNGTAGQTNPTVGLSYQLTTVTNGAEEGKYSLSVNVASTATEIAEFDKYGWRYLADYSANYTNRSLVDKAYVTAAVSDIRLKENITELPSTLEKVNLLRPVEFDFIATKEHETGFIAQEVEGIFPHLIIEDEDILKIKRNEWVPILVKAIQELTSKVAELEAKLNKNG